MPTYTLSSGESFTTILLSKGTVLFRGFEMNDTQIPFTELFGRQDDEGHYCVDPYHTTIFYSVPCMVDIVHAIYIIQYDLELVHTWNAQCIYHNSCLIKEFPNIHGFLREHAKSEYDLVLALNRIGASFSKHYQFSMGRYKPVYKMERVFPQKKKERRYTRKHRDQSKNPKP